MHYVRTARAAVASPQSEDARATAPTPRKTFHPTRTLWASRPLSVKGGRLVAVQLRRDELRVGLATDDGLKWVRPESVLNDAQAEAWARRSVFAEQTHSPGRRR